MLTPTSLLAAPFTPTPTNQQNDDYNNLAKLQWTAPPNILPGTYHDYLKTHPLTKAVFTTPITSPKAITYAILVDRDLYPDIKASLDTYQSDLIREGYTPFLDTVTGGTPPDIKSWVQTQYDNGARGALFIGDITAAWADVSGDTFPSDLYYMDLNGTWNDTDNDGVYETHTGHQAPELYVARLYATTLTYNTEAAMINQYFAKDHAYRTGTLTEPWRGLEYVEEDWYDMDVNLDNIYTDNVTRYDYGYFTTAADYLNQMDLGQHYVQVCVHSYSGVHYFSTRPTESAAYGHTYVYSPTTRPAVLLLGSDDGIAVWLDGNQVYYNDKTTGWIQDQFHVNITLNEGWNRILIKVSQSGGDYLSSVRITDLEGNAYPDLVYQLNNPETHGPDADYIRSFLLNGFHQDTSDNFWEYLTTNYLGVDEATLNPHEGDIDGGCTWTTYDSGNPFINLGTYCDGADYGVCYAYCRVYADNQTSCLLRLGYDDGARVWLNGEEILYDNRYGGFIPDMTTVNVTLQSGENHLMVKISEWMGDNGFSARFCTTDGQAVPGLSYDPVWMPISHIGTWLFNGPYVNPDVHSRLSLDYLEGESSIAPSEGDPAPFGSWQMAIGEGCPFNIGVFYDHGDWVYSSTIQDRDPPVLFFNLFACGPGRFTDEDYLAGAYIFNTSTVLSDVASSKSGSMLNFKDFTKPLGQGENLGESYHIWWDKQAPYSTSEKEWFYGLILNGDPTLCIPTAVQVNVTKPQNGIYLRGQKICGFPVPVIVGKVTVEAEAMCPSSAIDRVEFLLDGELQATDTTAPYSWDWASRDWFRHSVSIVAYDAVGRSTTQELTVWRFF
jgi:hypothetical protein